NYMDRTNIGFAQLQMKDQLAFSDAVFGFGAGVFFISYALSEVPSNMLLAKWGARTTMLRIMLLWGLASAWMMFVSTATQFYVLRFVLGAFEAGFVPGVLYYFTLWYPSHRRAQVTALFIAAFVTGPM
ncbi:MFS transporter, partial [Lactobacillus crispatus]|uniref:MFS transporter n=1 Tax=Lactobacillus crispatus TaxID=47770 RepID=UPI00105C328F